MELLDHNNKQSVLKSTVDEHVSINNFDSSRYEPVQSSKEILDTMSTNLNRVLNENMNKMTVNVLHSDDNDEISSSNSRN